MVLLSSTQLEEFSVIRTSLGTLVHQPVAWEPDFLGEFAPFWEPDIGCDSRHLQPLQDHRAVHLIVMVNSFIIVIFSGSARPFLFDDGLRVLPGSERVFIIR